MYSEGFFALSPSLKSICPPLLSDYSMGFHNTTMKSNCQFPPPVLDKESKYHPIHDPKYKGLDPKDIPDTESLKDTVRILCHPSGMVRFLVH